MTIKHRGQIGVFPRHKNEAIFLKNNENFTEEELLQLLDMQQKLFVTSCHDAAYEKHVDEHNQCVIEPMWEVRTKDKEICTSEYDNLDKERGKVHDCLLILAHSAELMSMSENKYNDAIKNYQIRGGLHTDPEKQSLEYEHNTATSDKNALGRQIDGISIIDHVGKAYESHKRKRTLRLTQIKHLARLKKNISAQQMIEEFSFNHLDKNQALLSQILHLTLSRNHSQQEEKTDSYPYGNPQRRIIRLSKVKHVARAKGNAPVVDAIGESVQGCLEFQDSRDKRARRIIAEIFGEEDIFQEGTETFTKVKWKSSCRAEESDWDIIIDVHQRHKLGYNSDDLLGSPEVHVADWNLVLSVANGSLLVLPIA